MAVAVMDGVVRRMLVAEVIPDGILRLRILPLQLDHHAVAGHEHHRGFAKIDGVVDHLAGWDRDRFVMGMIGAIGPRLLRIELAMRCPEPALGHHHRRAVRRPILDRDDPGGVVPVDCGLQVKSKRSRHLELPFERRRREREARCRDARSNMGLVDEIALARLARSCIAQEPLIEGMLKVKDSYNVDRLSMAAALAALDDQEHLRINIAKVRETRAYLTESLREMGFFVYPSQANFVFLRCPDSRTAREIYEQLKSQKILIRHLNYRKLEDCLRISIGTPEEIECLLERLSEITCEAKKGK